MKPSRTVRMLLGESTVTPLTPEQTPERWGGKLKTPPYYDPEQPELQATEAEKKDEVLDPSLNEVRLVVVKQRPVDYEVCPHCNQEIYERHTYIDGDFASGNYVERHSECKGAIRRPEPDPATVPDWLKPYMRKARFHPP